MAQIENLLYDFIRDNEIATENEIELVTNINGYSEETLNDIIHCRTEYHDVPQLYACEPENYYFSDELLRLTASPRKRTRRRTRRRKSPPRTY